jgi:hypothetical protein
MLTKRRSAYATVNNIVTFEPPPPDIVTRQPFVSHRRKYFKQKSMAKGERFLEKKKQRCESRETIFFLRENYQQKFEIVFLGPIDANTNRAKNEGTLRL